MEKFPQRNFIQYIFICVNPFSFIIISEDCRRFSHSDSFSINGKFYNELSGAIISANPLFPAPFLAVVCSGRVVGLQFPLGESFLLYFLLEKIQQPVGENLFSWFPFFTPVKRSLKSMPKPSLQRSKINKNLHQEILKESLFKVYFKFLLQEFLHFSFYQKV